MDNEDVFNSLCRICLQENANIPLFENDENQMTVCSKLIRCIHETVEDIEGFPKYICTPCNKMLDSICQFIEKYKESFRNLNNNILSIVKNEVDENTINDCDTLFDEEIDLTDVKIKLEQLDPQTDYLTEIDVDKEKVNEKPKTNKVIEKNRQQKDKKRKVPITNKVSKTNMVASSILEGVFAWTGERWCLSSSLPIVREKIKGRRPKLKLKAKVMKKEQSSKLCDICGEVYKNADRLRRHKHRVHIPPGSFKCPVEHCKKTCRNKYYLNKHVLRKHSQNQNFQCSTCGKTFTFKGEMDTHIKRTHSNEQRPCKTYSCKYCPKTYKCQKSVEIHERSAHTGSRPAVCTVCNSAFFHDDYLKQHMLLHTGETPYKCPVCGRGHAQRGNMKSHLRIHKRSELDAVTLQKMKPSLLKFLKV